jgi:transposase
LGATLDNVAHALKPKGVLAVNIADVPTFPTQDRRRLKRYRRRWKIERLFAWLQNFRRLIVRYERHAENFLGMLQLASSLILLRHL